MGPMDNYKVIRQIGKGSFGKVYLITCTQEGNKRYVLKVIKLKGIPQYERESCRNEVALLKRLDHPSIVGFKESFLTDNGDLAIVMTYCDGGELTTRISQHRERGQPMSEDTCLSYFVQIALAVHYMHEQRVLHRDIKSQNCFLLGNGRVVLGDFGISKALPQAGMAAFARTQIGTPLMMSPEILSNQKYDWKSDVWAMGCLAYELATGKHPFEAPSLAALASKVSKGTYAPLGPKFSTGFKGLVASLLAVNPAARPTMADVLKQPFVRKHIQAFIRDIAERAALGLNAAGSGASGSQQPIGEGTMMFSAAAIKAAGGSELMRATAAGLGPHAQNLYKQLTALGLQDTVAKALKEAAASAEAMTAQQRLKAGGVSAARAPQPQRQEPASVASSSGSGAAAVVQRAPPPAPVALPSAAVPSNGASAVPAASAAGAPACAAGGRPITPFSPNAARKLVKERKAALAREEERRQAVEQALERLRLERAKRLGLKADQPQSSSPAARPGAAGGLPPPLKAQPLVLGKRPMSAAEANRAKAHAVAGGPPGQPAASAGGRGASAMPSAAILPPYPVAAYAIGAAAAGRVAAKDAISVHKPALVSKYLSPVLSAAAASPKSTSSSAICSSGPAMPLDAAAAAASGANNGLGKRPSAAGAAAEVPVKKRPALIHQPASAASKAAVGALGGVAAGPASSRLEKERRHVAELEQWEKQWLADAQQAAAQAKPPAIVPVPAPRNPFASYSSSSGATPTVTRASGGKTPQPAAGSQPQSADGATEPSRPSAAAGGVSGLFKAMSAANVLSTIPPAKSPSASSGNRASQVPRLPAPLSPTAAARLIAAASDGARSGTKQNCAASQVEERPAGEEKRSPVLPSLSMKADNAGGILSPSSRKPSSFSLLAPSSSNNSNATASANHSLPPEAAALTPREDMRARREGSRRAEEEKQKAVLKEAARRSIEDRKAAMAAHREAFSGIGAALAGSLPVPQGLLQHHLRTSRETASHISSSPDDARVDDLIHEDLPAEEQMASRIANAEDGDATNAVADTPAASPDASVVSEESEMSSTPPHRRLAAAGPGAAAAAFEQQVESEDNDGGYEDDNAIAEAVDEEMQSEASMDAAAGLAGAIGVDDDGEGNEGDGDSIDINVDSSDSDFEIEGEGAVGLARSATGTGAADGAASDVEMDSIEQELQQELMRASMRCEGIRAVLQAAKASAALGHGRADRDSGNAVHPSGAAAIIAGHHHASIAEGSPLTSSLTRGLRSTRTRFGGHVPIRSRRFGLGMAYQLKLSSPAAGTVATVAAGAVDAGAAASGEDRPIRPSSDPRRFGSGGDVSCHELLWGAALSVTPDVEDTTSSSGGSSRSNSSGQVSPSAQVESSPTTTGSRALTSDTAPVRNTSQPGAATVGRRPMFAPSTLAKLRSGGSSGGTRRRESGGASVSASDSLNESTGLHAAMSAAAAAGSLCETVSEDLPGGSPHHPATSHAGAEANAGNVEQLQDDDYSPLFEPESVEVKVADVSSDAVHAIPDVVSTTAVTNSLQQQLSPLHAATLRPPPVPICNRSSCAHIRPPPVPVVRPLPALPRWIQQPMPVTLLESDNEDDDEDSDYDDSEEDEAETDGFDTNAPLYSQQQELQQHQQYGSGAVSGAAAILAQASSTSSSASVRHPLYHAHSAPAMNTNVYSGRLERRIAALRVACIDALGKAAFTDAHAVLNKALIDLELSSADGHGALPPSFDSDGDDDPLQTAIHSVKQQLRSLRLPDSRLDRVLEDIVSIIEMELDAADA